jgi:hypothetical protein
MLLPKQADTTLEPYPFFDKGAAKSLLFAQKFEMHDPTLS